MSERKFSNKEKYFHQGILLDNGYVDPVGVISDPDILNVSDFDLHNHPEVKIGNVEIWYFDILDLQNKCSIIVQFYFQTEAIKKEIGLYVTLFTNTLEHGVYNKLKRYDINELIILKDAFDIRIEKNHIYREYDPEAHRYIYNLKACIDDIILEVKLMPQMNGWKPFGNPVLFHDESRAGSFSVVSFVPKASVQGTISIKNKIVYLNSAIGYHDHTCWESRYKSEKFKNRLFVDDTIASWEFGKFVSKEYLIIFNVIYLRPWLAQPPIKTFLVAKDNRIIHSSHNLIKVTHGDFKFDSTTSSKYPTRISVELIQENEIITLDIKLIKHINKADLLEGMNRAARSLIRFIFGKPASYYMLTEAEITFSGKNTDTRRITGPLFYELLILNDHPTHFEDYLRKKLHKMIR